MGFVTNGVLGGTYRDVNNRSASMQTVLDADLLYCVHLCRPFMVVSAELMKHSNHFDAECLYAGFCQSKCLK